jgi:site-specific recombinase XerD
MVRPPEVLSAEEVQALIRASAGKGPTAIRNRALIAVLYRGGLRISEALALYPRDLDRAAGTLHVRDGKGGNARLVVIDGDAMAHLDLWLAERKRLGANGRHPLFCTIASGKTRKVGDPLHSAYFRRKLPELGRKAGIDKRVHAHGLRHTHAAELVAEGNTLTDIRDQLGHTNAATTDVYLRQIAPADRIERMRARGRKLADD